jgi:Raf kinase inhibitor-like YbhB/YbcL family protein
MREEDTTMHRVLASTLFVLPLVASCSGGPPTESILPDNPKAETISLHSSAFAEGASIPKAYTCDGTGVSPPLDWSSTPGSARSLALIAEDPDAPGGTFTHWVLFNMPATTTKLAEGIPAEESVALSSGEQPAHQGKNGFGKVGYGGPCPPRGTHRYVFRLYALDAMIQSAQAGSREQLLGAMKGHVLAEGRLTGKYAR